jgi:hypothetical protein
LRSARARREERVDVVVSLDIVDELLMLLLSVALLPVDPVLPLLVVSRVALPVVPAPYDVVPDDVVPVPVADEPVAPVPLVDEPLVAPVAVPLERVVLLGLLIDPLEVPVEPVVPAFGPELVVLLLGEPEAPPWPPPPVPVCASAPPHAIAAAAERARILKVCLMGYS